MNKVIFKSRKEATKFLKEKGIDASNWTEEKWQSINKSQAEIHIQALAESMWDAYNESIPKTLQSGDWHIPFNLDNFEIFNLIKAKTNHSNENFILHTGIKGGIEIEDIFRKEIGLDTSQDLRIKIATARAARLSYMTFDGEIDYQKDIELHDRLLESKHASPMEHCARAMSNDEYESFYKGQIGLGGESGWCNNFRGWIQYRHLIENKS